MNKGIGKKVKEVNTTIVMDKDTLEKILNNPEVSICGPPNFFWSLCFSSIALFNNMNESVHMIFEARYIVSKC